MGKNKYAKAAKQARKLRRREQMCNSKRAYETETEAAKTGNQVYRCPYCQKFHTTAQFNTLANTLRNRMLKQEAPHHDDR